MYGKGKLLLISAAGAKVTWFNVGKKACLGSQQQLAEQRYSIAVVNKTFRADITICNCYSDLPVSPVSMSLVPFDVYFSCFG